MPTMRPSLLLLTTLTTLTTLSMPVFVSAQQQGGAPAAAQPSRATATAADVAFMRGMLAP